MKVTSEKIKWGLLLIALLLLSSVQIVSAEGGYVYTTSWSSSAPFGVAVDHSTGNVYVAEYSGNQVQVFDSSGTFITKWGSPGSADGQFSNPRGVALDSAGNVYVADTGNDRIQKFNSSGTLIMKWGGSGSANGQFSSPIGVAVDSAGNVYVADAGNGRIQKFDSSGTFILNWSTPGSPYSLAVDSAGHVYVADASQNQVKEFTSTGTLITAWGSSGSANGQFNTPLGVAVDSTGNVYVTDQGNNRIQKFTSIGGFLTTWGSYGYEPGQFVNLRGIAVDSVGNVYVADANNYRIQKFAPEILPVTNFIADMANGTSPLTVGFTDQSTGSPTSWLWDFGDGNTSTVQNPGYTYTIPGIYSVNLTATNAGGSTTQNKAGYITVTAPVSSPIADFTANVTNGTSPLTVGFTDQSTGSPTSWLWDFSDGNTSTVQNPVYTYTIPGIYSVNLTATNAGGSTTQNKAGYITVTAPVSSPIADFTANVTNGTSPLAVGFTDQSTGSVTSWLWDFGDGNTSTVQNPVYTYTIPGIYSVNLTATNVGGSTTQNKAGYITVTAPVSPPVTDFIANMTNGTSPLAVGFTDQSTGSPTSWLWDFGDGNTSTVQNPVHVFNLTGAYTVSLTATNAGGSTTTTKTGFITVQAPVPTTVPTTVSTTVSTTMPTTVPTTVSTTVPTGYVYNTSWSSNGPYGVAVDHRTGNVYVAEYSTNQVQEFTSTGTFITKWGTLGSGDGQFDQPRGVAVDSAGNIYVADSGNNRTQKFDSSGTFLTKWGSSGSGDGQFWAPIGVAVDSAGNIYVADAGNFRIQKFDSSGTFLTKWGSQGSVNGQFYGPYALAVDSTGNIYVADTLKNEIQEFTSTGIFITKWGTPGSANGQFNTPQGIAVDSAGNVYVTDAGNNRIQKFTSIGGFLMTWGSYGYGPGQFVNLKGIAVDSIGNVYVADMNNQRVQKFAPEISVAPPVTDFIANVTNGTSPLTVGFTVPSTGSGTSWLWGFGDNTTSTEQNPVHTYTTPGIYSVNLTTTNAFGSTIQNKPGYITVTVPVTPTPTITATSTITPVPTASGYPPVANFTVTPFGNQKSLGIQITDTSVNATSVRYDLGDGMSTTTRTFKYTYRRAGTYTIKQTATNAAGSSTKTIVVTVPVKSPPVASFTVTPQEGSKSLSIHVTDTSVNADSVRYDLGDGMSTTTRTFKYTYRRAGTYTIKQTATSSAGSSTKTIVVTVPVKSPPVANFKVKPLEGSRSLSIQVTDTSMNADSVRYDLGDGTSTTSRDFRHTYRRAGKYTIKQTATSSAGSSTKTIVVTVPAGRDVHDQTNNEQFGQFGQASGLRTP